MQVTMQSNTNINNKTLVVGVPEHLNQISELTIEDENIIEKLYGNTLVTSISQLAKYKSCPFLYFLQYGLKLSEKDTTKVQPVDTGTFMHEVIDEFFSKIEENRLSIKSINEEDVNKIVDEIILENFE